MKKTYVVSIEETLCKSFVVEAESGEEAKSIIEKAYDSEDIMLTADNYSSTEFDFVEAKEGDDLSFFDKFEGYRK